MFRQVLLFSGHRIDAPGRAPARFPADMEQYAAQAIEAALRGLKADQGDLAIASAACGGDILFAEACLQYGVRTHIFLPFAVPAFLTACVDYAKSGWRKRFFNVEKRTTPHIMSNELGPATPDENAYERLNIWMLDFACSYGIERLNFICLWDGKGGDGPGGTKHLIDEVLHRKGRVTWLNTQTLWR